jgi:fatty acid desaturase
MQDERPVSPTFNEWFLSISPEMKEDVRALHKKDTRWNWILMMFYSMWIASAALMYIWPVLIVKLICYTLIGLALHGMATIMHEAMHNNAFTNKKLNWLYGFIAGIPSFFSITAYKVNHSIHHRYTGTEKDPDELFNITSNKILTRIMFYIILMFGVVLYLFHVPVNALRFGSASERKQIVLEYLIMFSIYTIIILSSLHYDFFNVVLNVWLIPIIFAVLFGNIRGWAEHMLTDKSHVLLSTRTVTSSKLFSLLNLNLNYHLEHHLFPNIPWYNLPKLHRMLLPEYNQYNVVVYSSYPLFLWEAFRSGPFKVI